MTLEISERVPTSAMSEAHLVQGYSRAALPDSISRPCACGAVVVAVSGTDQDVGTAVADHARSIGHEAWSLRWRSA